MKAEQSNTRVIFEAYKLRHRNNGLYQFTLEMIKSLEKLKSSQQCEMEYLVPSNFDVQRSAFAHIKHRVLRFYHKLFTVSGCDVDVWHIPYQGSAFTAPRGVKTVLTVHDLNFLYEKNEQKQQKYLTRLQADVANADKVVCISHFTLSELTKHIDILGKDVEVIHNGCNIYRGDIALPEGMVAPQNFLFGLGTILLKKNWHVLVSLLVDNDFQLIIAGKLSSYADVILAHARSVGVEDRVSLVGEVGEAQKHWYLSNCAAFLFPSVAEGFGLPVVEAMYYGCPVFISSHTSLPEIGGEDVYYFPADFDPQKMRADFKRDMSDFTIDIGRGKRLHDRAMSFSWDVAATKYLTIYRTLR